MSLCDSPMALQSLFQVPPPSAASSSSIDMAKKIANSPSKKIKTAQALPFMTRHIKLPVFLPQIDGIDAERFNDCCNITQAESFLDHAKDFHAFSLEKLAWAMQHQADVASIERYLNSFDPATVKSQLSSPLKDCTSADVFPILFFAVEQNSPEIVRVLCKAGADPSKGSEPTGLPLLAYTILSAEYDLSDTTDTLIALLAEQAKPEQVPCSMWKTPLQAPRADSPTASEDGYFTFRSWCTPELRKALARNLTLMQRYSLWRAKHLASSTPRMVQIATAFNILPLLETPYHIIGQTPAIRQVVDAVASHYLFDSGFPLVMLFTGASGHGKTEVAKRMGNLLSLDIYIVDCTEMRYETDIFGPKAPYMGHEKGSMLNNFLAEHSGQRAVVFLDEFEKTTAGVHKAMLLPFESGMYQDRRNGTKLDCTKIIWILAANLGEELIQKFWSTSMENASQTHSVQVDYEKLCTLLENVAIRTFGAPLTGRLSYTIPFVPFNDLEQAVTTYKFMREFKNEIRKPVNVEAKLFPRRLILNYKDDGQLAQHLASNYYSHELGARSLQKAVHRHVKQKLAHTFLNEQTIVYDMLNEEPMATYEATLNGHEVSLERRGVSNVKRDTQPQFPSLFGGLGGSAQQKSQTMSRFGDFTSSGGGGNPFGQIPTPPNEEEIEL